MRPIIIYLLLSTQVCIHVAKSVENPKSGPYVSIPLRSEHCKGRNIPYQKNPTLKFDGFLYNSSSGTIRVKGNITFYRPAADIRITNRLYRLDNGRREISFIMNSKGCRGIAFSSLLWAFGVNYDIKKCVVQKGTFSIDVDPNMIEHVLYSTREYGHLLWVTDVLAGKEMILCWEHEVLIKPLQTKV